MRNEFQPPSYNLGEATQEHDLHDQDNLRKLRGDKPAKRRKLRGDKPAKARLWWEIEKDNKREMLDIVVTLRNDIRKITGLG